MTDGPTDKAGFRVACTRLKTKTQILRRWQCTEDIKTLNGNPWWIQTIWNPESINKWSMANPNRPRWLETPFSSKTYIKNSTNLGNRARQQPRMRWECARSIGEILQLKCLTQCRKRPKQPRIIDRMYPSQVMPLLHRVKQNRYNLREKYWMGLIKRS